MHRSRSHQLTLLIAAWLLGSALSTEAADLHHVREIYVPHDEFLRRSQKNPDGIVMALSEYRSIVREALDQPEEATVDLPPVEAIVSLARHEASLHDRSVRVVSRLEVHVARDGWVLCPLGFSVARPGRILVDGKPGWAVLETPPPSKGKRKKPAQPSASLVLRGKGRHIVEIHHSIQATEKQDVWRISGIVPRAAAARWILTVPGDAVGTSNPPFLDASRILESDSTRFELALGQAQHFQMTWQARRQMGMSDSLLLADHGISLLPRQSLPSFLWTIDVDISRSATDRIQILEPPGLNVVQLSGKRVHRWTRDLKTLTVTLNEAILGPLQLTLRGVIELAPGIVVPQDGPMTFDIGGAAVAQARVNRGYIAIQDPNPDRVEVVQHSGLIEVSRKESKAAIVPGSEVARAFSFATSDHSIRLRSHRNDASFESRAALKVQVLERSISLTGFYRLRVVKGRIYSLHLKLPEPWRLQDLKAVEIQGQKLPAASREVSGTGDARELEIRWTRALRAGTSLELMLRFDHSEFRPEFDWTESEQTFRVPYFSGATRTRVDVGLSLARAIDAVSIDKGNWKALRRGEMKVAGLEGGNVVAAMTSNAPTDPLTILLRHRSPRGEYEAVSHLLALERRLRIRTDIRFAIVDRAVEEIRLLLPVDETTPVAILGEGIKEISVEAADSNQSIRVIRFVKPWLGTRQLRIELERDHAAGQPTAIPSPTVLGSLTGTRIVAFQSLGPVELVDSPQNGLEPMELDDVPDFSTPWKVGRKLMAFRVKSRGDLGTFLTRIYPRVNVVGSFARELELVTMITSQGIARTMARMLLAYSDRQFLDVVLPSDARILEIQIGNDRVRSVRPHSESEPGGGRRWSIPLPPRSYADVQIIYERDHGPLATSWGSWLEEGPRFLGVPVGTTKWRLYHPPGYRFFLDGGNLQAVDATLETRSSTFSGAMFDRLMGKGSAGWSIDQPAYHRRAYSEETVQKIRVQTTASKTPTAQSSAPQQTQMLAPDRSTKARQTSDELVEFDAEGYVILATKIGGNPSLGLNYSSFAWRAFAPRLVFLAMLIAGLIFVVLRGRRALLRTSALGLAYGIALPPVLHWLLAWESPFLLIPICEGLAALVAISLCISLWKFAVRLVEKRRVGTAQTAGIILIAMFSGSALDALAAEETAKPGDGAAKPADEILIPYDPEELFAPDPHRKVFVPYDHFRKLWLAAHPEEAPPAEETGPRDLVIGNAEYALVPGESSFEIRGSVRVLVFTKRWASLPLPFEASKLVQVKLDGKSIGFSQKGSKPYIPIRGQGEHLLELVISGGVDRKPGLFSVVSDLVTGTGTTVSTELPAGAQVLTGSTPQTKIETQGDKTIATTYVKQGERFELRWHFPGVEGKSASQVDSQSYSRMQLTLDGYRIDRQEVVRVTGEPVRAIEYRLIGDWDIGRVSAPELSEWSIVKRGENRFLDLRFFRPLSRILLMIGGSARLGDDALPVASLELQGATRHMSLFGLEHGDRRRWTPESLAGARRDFPAELRRGFSMPAEDYDRLYQLFGTGSDQSVAATPLRGNTEVTTECVLIVQSDRLFLSGRSKYRVSGPGPYRHVVSIAGVWNVLTATGSSLRDWESSESDGETHITMYLDDRARTADEIIWSAELPWDAPPSPLSLPQIRTIESGEPLRSETIFLAIAGQEALDLAFASQPRGLTSLPLERAPTWVKLPTANSYRFALRSTGSSPAYSLDIAPSSPTSRLGASVVSFARASDDELLVNSRILYRVQRAGRGSFQFRLPRGAELVSMDLRNQKSRRLTETAAGLTIEFELISPVLGEIHVDLVHRIPRPQDEESVTLQAIVVLDGESPLPRSNHYVGFLQTGNALTSAGPSTGLISVAPETLPHLPAGVDVSQLQTFRATSPNWQLLLEPDSVDAIRDLRAKVDLAEIATVLAADGTLRTRAAFTLRNRKLQFLKVELPEDAVLWGVTLGGRPVLVSRDAKAGRGVLYRVPLEHVGSGDLNLEIALVYNQPEVNVADGSLLHLAAPKVIGIDVSHTVWELVLPEDYSGSLSRGNMQDVAGSIQHATKVENLLQQIDRLKQTADESKSSSLRLRAEGNLSQLEMALSDTVEDLEKTIEEAESGQSANNVEQSQLRMQVVESRKLLKRGLDALEESKATAKAKKQAASEGRAGEQGRFENDFQFLYNSWRGGKKAAPTEVKTGADKAQGGEISIESLGRGLDFQGYRDASVLTDPGIESARARPIDAPGLPPLPASTGAPIHPALETPPARAAGQRLMFRRMAGDAEIDIRLHREGAWKGLASLLTLGALIGLHIAWRRRTTRKISNS